MSPCPFHLALTFQRGKIGLPIGTQSTTAIKDFPALRQPISVAVPVRDHHIGTLQIRHRLLDECGWILAQSPAQIVHTAELTNPYGLPVLVKVVLHIRPYQLGAVLVCVDARKVPSRLLRRILKRRKPRFVHLLGETRRPEFRALCAERGQPLRPVGRCRRGVNGGAIGWTPVRLVEAHHVRWRRSGLNDGVGEGRKAGGVLRALTAIAPQLVVAD